MTAHAKEPSDEDIARVVQEGNGEAFGTLVERYEAKLLRYGRKFLARQEDIEDIVQDVFLKAYENIKGFDVTQRFSPWIYRIAHNAYINTLKRQRLGPITLFDFDTVLAHHTYEDPQEEERERRDMQHMLERGLSKLQPKYREVLVLHYFENMAYKDIADVLQVPTGTVGIRLKRAKEALQKEYEKLDTSV